jgi:hypothetical protein
MNKKIIILLIMLIIPSLIKGEERKMQIKMTTLHEDRYEDLLLTSEMPVRTFKLKKEARLVEGKYWTHCFYLENPSGTAFGPMDDPWVSKQEYEKDSKIMLGANGRPNKDIYYETLPVGTRFELIKIEFNARSLGKNHYWIKLIDREEYKDILIDAVALTGVSDGYMWSYWWSGFIDFTPYKEKIKPKKVPMFKGKWAKEIKEKK